MSALPARSASSRRIGSARALSASVWGPSPLSAIVSTPVSRPFVSVARTWMTENGVATTGPVPVFDPGGAGVALGRSGVPPRHIYTERFAF